MKSIELKNYLDSLFNPKWQCYNCQYCTFERYVYRPLQVKLKTARCIKKDKKINAFNNICSETKLYLRDYK